MSSTLSTKFGGYAHCGLLCISFVFEFIELRLLIATQIFIGIALASISVQMRWHPKNSSLVLFLVAGLQDYNEFSLHFSVFGPSVRL